MSTTQGRTQTHERVEQRSDEPGITTRLIRIFRAEDPFDEIASFPLSRQTTWRIGRTDGRPSASLQDCIWTNGDKLMSARHALLSEQNDSWYISDQGSKNGTFVNGVRLTEPRMLRHGDIIECGRSFFLLRRTRHETARLGLQRVPSLQPPPFRYQIAPLSGYLRSDVSVHLYGETGTGKEVIARALHALSERPGRFVAINCAAIPETLFESEMFGHKKGAFSGAVNGQRGAVLAAHGGTLFLDEIGELPLPLQAKLLRALELKEVLPIGADRPMPVDFRLVSATLCDLKTMVSQGRFRPDLYARLGHTFHVPPLRAHKEELGHVVKSCLAAILMGCRASGQQQPKIGFTLEAARALVHYDWPCNIRELKQSVDRAVLAALAEAPPGSTSCNIGVRHLPLALRGKVSEIYRSSVDEPVAMQPACPQERVQVPSDADVLNVLRDVQGNRSEAAKRLGIRERTIYRRLKRLREGNQS
jgi:transcriptional regulator with AAA-type ATPase domain